jgi:ankyrin repeat protein
MTKENSNYDNPNNLLHRICWGFGDYYEPEARIKTLELLFANADKSSLDINCSIDGNTALTIACQTASRNPEVVKFLLKNGAKVDLPNKNGDTPLIIAAINDSDICKVLLENKANTNIQNQNGDSALMHLVESQELETIKLFPNSSVNLQNEKGETALIIACKNLQTVFLKREGIRGISPSAEAVNQNVVSNEIIKILLEKGANPSIKNEQGQNSLTSLSGKIGYYNAYQLTEIAFERRSEEGKIDYKEKVREKLNQGASRKVKEAIDLLISYKANIHESDNSGKTALKIASDNHDEILLEELLKAGANEYELKIGKPEYKYLTNEEDAMNISRGSSGWSLFAGFVAKSVINKTRNVAEYPRVNLNKDNSISFFFENVVDKSGMKDISIKEFLSQESFVEQFKFRAKQHNFNVIGGGNILQITPHDLGDMTEYKFNLSPENFDTIMKLNPNYVGYKQEGSILKLNKNFVLKEDSIRLFPALRMNNNEFLVRAAGCQFFEIPTLQLMKLLPNYEDEILPKHQKDGFSFHWIPKEVEKELCFDRKDFDSVLLKVFDQNGIFVSEGNDRFHENPELLTINNPQKQSKIRIVATDNDSKDFYAIS